MRRAATVFVMYLAFPSSAAQPPEPLKLPIPVQDLVRALTETLKDTDPDVRVNAANALAAIRAPAVDALTAALGDPNRDGRAAAAYSLGVMGGEATPAVPTLVKSLKDAEADVRRQAAQARAAFSCRSGSRRLGRRLCRLRPRRPFFRRSLP